MTSIPATCLLLLLSLLSGSQARAADAAEPLDYALLSHKISIETLRAGAHSIKGTNDYTFVVTMYGLLNSAEERNMEFDKRKKTMVEVGKFGNTAIASLDAWHADVKAKNVKELAVDGKMIRELAAKTMDEFKVPESDVIIQVDVVMMLTRKKWLVLGDDEKVGTASYKAIAASLFEHGLRTNQDLLITDDKGTYVKLAIRYDKPATAAKDAKSGKAISAKSDGSTSDLKK